MVFISSLSHLLHLTHSQEHWFSSKTCLKFSSKTFLKFILFSPMPRLLPQAASFFHAWITAVASLMALPLPFLLPF